MSNTTTYRNETDNYFCKVSSPACLISESILIFIGLASLAANALVLAVLLRRQLRHEYSKFRWHLILITAVEITFCISFVVFHIGILHSFLSSTLAFHIAYSSHEASHAARNWAAAAVTIARAESIAWPLQSRSRRLFTTTRMTIAIICIFLIFFLGCISSLLISKAYFPLYVDNIVFFLSRPLPMLAVIIGTILISRKLLCATHLPSQSTQNSRAMTRTVVLLAVLFTIFEGASMPFYIVLVCILNATSNVMSNIDNFFLILNSFSNIFAFVIGNKSFRRETRELVTCKCSERSSTTAA